MVSFEDDDDHGSEDENEDDDENMEDEGDAEGDEDADGDDMDAEGDNDEDQDQDVEQDADQDNDQDDNDNDDDEDQEDNDNENDNDQDNDQDNENNNDNENESPSQSRRQSRASPTIRRGASAPKVTLTSPSPRPSSRHSPSAMSAFWPSTPPEALAASTYDIVPTMAAPQNTSINSMATTPDMRWVFSGGADGYIRMYNWVETANGKVPLTVAQKHPFVDSVMKAGSLTTYWENEESSVRTPPAQSADEPKDLSPVYSLAAHHQAVWLLSGLESGGINLQTCRHQAGTRITTLREHTSAVSVLDLAHDELSFLSGSWDKTIHDWDLNVGKVKRTFRGSGGQISAIERRPESSIPVPTITEDQAISSSSTFSSNNADKPATNGVASLPNGTNPPRRGSRNTENGTEDAAASPDGSLFGDDSGSLFGDNDDAANGGSRSNNFDDDDEFSKAIANDIHQQNEDDANANVNVDADADTDTDMDAQATALKQEKDVDMTDAGTSADQLQQSTSTTGSAQPIASDPEAAITASKDVSATTNGVSHAENASTTAPSAVTASIDASLPPAQTSSTTFLDAAIDGTIRIWDRRMPDPIARLLPPRGTPPWCMAACWSPDGNTIYAGRRNQTVEEYSIHKGFHMPVPERVLRFPAESKAVSAVKMMPNGRHLVCASYDILRLYDVHHPSLTTSSSASNVKTSTSTTPFLIIPGHRTGVVSALHVDPTCRFMISIAGNRGWEGASTETLLGYEIHIPPA